MTGIQVIPAGAREISAVRTNDAWQLQKPLAYPAQAAAIEALLAALEKLAPATRLTAAELRGHKNADAEFGFDNPQFSLDVAAGDQRWHLLVGNKTAPGDQVFIRVVGLDGAFVTDAGWLRLLPRSADDWRDTALVDAAGVTRLDCHHQRREGHRIPARPDEPALAHDPAAADARGQRAHRRRACSSSRPAASRNSSPTIRSADLGSYGLQPADLDVWLGRGTNFICRRPRRKKSGGKSRAAICARREGWNSVVHRRQGSAGAVARRGE